MVGASGAAPGWHCHSNPVLQVLLSKDSSILCDGSSSAQGHVWWQVFHTVPKPVFWRLNKPAGKLVFRVTTARAGGAGLQQVPPEAWARTERLQSGPCRWPDQLLLLCLSLGPAEEQQRAGSVLCIGMRSAMRCVSSPLPVAGCESSSLPRCLHRVSHSGTDRELLPRFNKQPGYKERLGGRGAPSPPRCSGHPGGAGRSWGGCAGARHDPPRPPCRRGSAGDGASEP